jgi:hypothetical protein
VSFDEAALEVLIEESQDLQVDAMRTTRAALTDAVEYGRDRQGRGQLDPDESRHFHLERRRLLLDGLRMTGVLAAGGVLGTALVSFLERPAFAQRPGTTTDVQILQTAASLENLAVATYGVALTLPFIGGSAANPVVKKFAMTTMQQHSDHGKAFNAAVRNLGGKEQTQPDPVLLETVNSAKPTLTGPAQVVDLALTLEQTATEDYVAGVNALSDPMGKQTMSSIMGVESQHAATLRAVKALLAANAPQLIALPPDAAKLPPAAGSVGFPDTFMGTSKKRPNQEGAVK